MYIYNVDKQEKTNNDNLLLLYSNLMMSTKNDSYGNIIAPEGLSYLPYQKNGIEFGLKNHGVLIADEPGLGKTIQAIGIINADPSMRKILVVCPASLKINWSRELAKWLVIPRTIGIVSGMPTGGIELGTMSSAANPFVNNVVIINYELLPYYSEQIAECHWDMIIADECHILRNPETTRTQHVIGDENSIPPIAATRKVFLSGTPILNKAEDIWALVSYLRPDIWDSYNDFASRFGDETSPERLEALQTLLRGTVMVRRLKKDVLTELPPKKRFIVKLQHRSSEIDRLLQEERSLFCNEIKNAMTNQALGGNDDWDEYAFALESLEKTRKVALCETSAVRHKIALAKVPMVISYIEQALKTTRKIVVFAHHQDVITQIADYFGSIAVSFTGQCSPAKKQEAIDLFQGAPHIRLCVCSILAAGVGVTLTASSRAIFAELDWTAANITQAEDRIHRIGQKYTVTIEHLILNGSIDLHLAMKIITKQKIYDCALNNGNN